MKRRPENYQNPFKNMRYFNVGYQTVDHLNNRSFGDLSIKSEKFPNRLKIHQWILDKIPEAYSCTLTYMFEFKCKEDWESYNET